MFSAEGKISSSQRFLGRFCELVTSKAGLTEHLFMCVCYFLHTAWNTAQIIRKSSSKIHTSQNPHYNLFSLNLAESSWKEECLHLGATDKFRKASAL